ncbi:hypothetical protein FRC10_010804 [Ceratobasidium sp. 414]|nr:hypothetical protein FRC10_010804 [Ceratobasidium sp. 414]
MTDKEFHILIIGATGYTGHLVVEYLSTHKLASSLRIALAGRTLSKVKELIYDHDSFQPVYVDLDDEKSVLTAVERTQVVINLAGPYWPRGSVVVRYDYLAHKTRACIVPCCGVDSLPSDLACYLGTKTLEGKIFWLGASRPLSITSTASFRGKGGISGGTAASMFNYFEVVPREKRSAGSGWGLSPINEPIVRRSWGLVERHRRESSHSSSPSPTFSYTEFFRTPGPISGIGFSLAFFVFGLSMALIPPFRWIVKWLLPRPGEGPSKEGLKSGWFEVVNVTGTEVMLVECALMLLDTSTLTNLAREGGILTPTTAFGGKLGQALERTGKFQMSSVLLVEDESKKTR